MKGRTIEEVFVIEMMWLQWLRFREVRCHLGVITKVAEKNVACDCLNHWFDKQKLSGLCFIKTLNAYALSLYKGLIPHPPPPIPSIPPNSSSLKLILVIVFLK